MSPLLDLFKAPSVSKCIIIIKCKRMDHISHIILYVLLKTLLPVCMKYKVKVEKQI